MRSTLVLALLALALLGTAPVAAQPSRDTATAVETLLARRLFQEASELREKGDYPGAIAKLREVVQLKETAGVRLHLGHALAASGQLVEALASYDRAEELMRAGSGEADLSKALATAREETEARIPTVAIRCARACEIKAVIIDQKPFGKSAASSPIRVDPGAHRVEVYAAGRAPYVTDITTKERERVEVVPKWPGAASAVSPPQAPPPALEREAKADSTTKTWVLVGEGAFALAGVTLGLVFGNAANSAEDRAIRQRADLFAKTGTTNFCGNPTPSLVGECSELEDTNDARKRNDTLATVSLAAAGVGVAAMLATVLLWPKAEAHAGRSSPRLVAGVSPGTIQVGVAAVLR